MPWALKTRKEASLIKKRKSNRPSVPDLDQELSRLLDNAFKMKATRSAHVLLPRLARYSEVRQGKVLLSRTKMSRFWYGSCNIESTYDAISHHRCTYFRRSQGRVDMVAFWKDVASKVLI
jgi:hypothetical protein